VKVEAAEDLFDGENPRVAVFAEKILELLQTNSEFRKRYDGKLHSIWSDVPWGEIMKLLSTTRIVSHDEPIPECDIPTIVQYFMQLVNLNDNGLIAVRVPPGMHKIAWEWTKAFREQNLKVSFLHVQLADSWCNTKCAVNSKMPSLTRTGHMWIIARRAKSMILYAKNNFSKFCSLFFQSLFKDFTSLIHPITT